MGFVQSASRIHSFDMNFGLSDLKELKPRNDKMDNLSYLVDNYLSESARFPHHQWNYHMALSEHDFTITTNSLENLNGKLKAKVGTGFLSRPKAYKKLKEFHSDYICLYKAEIPKTGAKSVGKIRGVP